ncbi:MAG: ABC transporter permease [Bryobacterales bacterium]|nr:ABC transporter permease [Bryobacterales bacterium]
MKLRPSSFSSGIPLALQALREHKLRAALTVLGVVIGTGAIIGVGSILAGFDGAVANVMNSFGADKLVVFKFKIGFRMGRLSPEERNRKPLSLENVRAIRERCPSVRAVAPQLFAPWERIHRVRYRSNDIADVNLNGVEESFIDVDSIEMEQGRFFTAAEDSHRLPVVVLGADAATALFGTAYAVGKEIDVDGHKVAVLGVMKRPAASMPGDSDRRVMLPYHTLRKMFPGAREHLLFISAYPGRQAAAADEVRTVLRQERRVKYNEPDSFYISTPEQIIEDFRRITSTTALVMIALSSIGLLVGGIGVMNIMLVSVTERTREIGVRKAIGARRIDIVAQFLTEAVLLTLAGGLAGMLAGYGVSLAARAMFPALPTQVPLWAVVLGVAVSAGVGLFFGIWPASKAARLDPVEALRYE